MTYKEAEQYLFQIAPVFQRDGKGAYKPGLRTTVKLDQHFGRPHTRYKTIHVGGTNGKGSVSHTLAAILQAQGYRVGLYTSPHLITFRERIRVNGEMIPEERVVRFIEDERAFFEPLHPSFFELTTVLAFKYFEEQDVDVAVVEVGLGGRLDCTNIITPIAGVITNVGLDHTDLLGDTITQISCEKAGIFKHGVPMIIGEVTEDTIGVYKATSEALGTPLFYAQSEGVLRHVEFHRNYNRYETIDYGFVEGRLSGQVQFRNTRTVLTVLRHLDLAVSAEAVQKGFVEVCTMTGLMGRWQIVSERPQVICDTGHNADAWFHIGHRLCQEAEHRRVHIVLGMSADKDVDAVLGEVPKKAAYYYFTQASVRRALPADELASRAKKCGISGGAYADVPAAYHAAKAVAGPDDLVFVGGSTFVVADFLTLHHVGAN